VVGGGVGLLAGQPALRAIAERDIDRTVCAQRRGSIRGDGSSRSGNPQSGTGERPETPRSNSAIAQKKLGPAR